MTNLLLFMLAAFMPWVLGYAIVKLFFRTGNYQLFAIGTGYVVGWYATSLLLRGYDYLDWPFEAITLCVAGYSLVALLLILQPKQTVATRVYQKKLSFKLVFILSTLIITLLLYRWGLTAIDLLSKPVLPWDGWASWSAKAKIFYYYKEIYELYSSYIPFWEFETADGISAGAVRHPYFISLIQTYMAIAWGGWSDSIVNLPWLGLHIALVCIIVGGLRYLGVSFLPSLLTAYAAASLPMSDTHVSLGAYADLWVGVIFLAAVLLLVMALVFYQWRLLVLVIMLILMLYFTKNTAVIFVFTLIYMLLWRFLGRYFAMALLLALLFGLYYGIGWQNTQVAKLLQQFFSSGVHQQLIIYNDVTHLVWLQWGILDNWHYVFFASLLSMVIAMLSVNKGRKCCAFELIAVIGAACIIIILALALFTAKMPVAAFTAYFNRITLYFVFILIVIPVMAYHFLVDKSNKI